MTGEAVALLGKLLAGGALPYLLLASGANVVQLEERVGLDGAERFETLLVQLLGKTTPPLLRNPPPVDAFVLSFEVGPDGARTAPPTLLPNRAALERVVEPIRSRSDGVSDRHPPPEGGEDGRSIKRQTAQGESFIR